MEFVDELLDKDNDEYSWAPHYGNMVQLKKALLYKRIVRWDTDELHLEDGIIVTLETSEADCCAVSEGVFSNVELDAVITDIQISEITKVSEDERDDTTKVEVFIYHNKNTIAKAEMTADRGGSGYYYSVGSIVIENVHFPIVEA